MCMTADCPSVVMCRQAPPSAAATYSIPPPAHARVLAFVRHHHQPAGAFPLIHYCWQRCRPRLSRPLLRSVENDEAMTAEWSATWNLKSYEDLAEGVTASFQHKKELAKNTLGSIMSSPAITVTEDTPVTELGSFFDTVSGLPVVDLDGKLLGVVSKKDMCKTAEGNATVGDIMSRPPLAAESEYKVSDGAAIMLRNEVDRLPIVDKDKRVIGLVSRTDICTALGDKHAAEA